MMSRNLTERVQVMLTPTQKAVLDRMADVRGSYPSVIAREAIMRFLEEELEDGEALHGHSDRTDG